MGQDDFSLITKIEMRGELWERLPYCGFLGKKESHPFSSPAVHPHLRTEVSGRDCGESVQVS